MILFDELGDFFQQIPAALIINVCGSGLLLLGAFVYFAWFKPRRNNRKRREREALEGRSTPSYPDVAASSPAYDADMPDLDLLLSTPEPDMPVPGQRPIQRGVKFQIPLHNGDAIESEEVVSVLRDPRDGRLVVYMNDMGYRTLTDAPDVKSEFVKIMRELSDVVTQPDPMAAPAPEPAMQPEPEAEEFAPELEPRDEVEAAEEAPPPPPAPKREDKPSAPPKKAAPLPGDLPSFKLDDHDSGFQKQHFFSRPKVEFKPVPELDLAGSIEAFLQHKLETTGAYPDREIHVHSAPGGGVRIQVGDKYYDAVSDVDDAEVRDFLATTIEEWQERQ